MKYKLAPEPVAIELTSWTPNWETINQKGYEEQTTERIKRVLIFDACGGRLSLWSPIRYTSSPIIKRTRLLTLSAVHVGTVKQGERQHMMPFLVAKGQALNVTKLPLPLNPIDLDQPYKRVATDTMRFGAPCVPTPSSSAVRLLRDRRVKPFSDARPRTIEPLY